MGFWTSFKTKIPAMLSGVAGVSGLMATISPQQSALYSQITIASGIVGGMLHSLSSADTPQTAAVIEQPAKQEPIIQAPIPVNQVQPVHVALSPEDMAKIVAMAQQLINGQAPTLKAADNVIQAAA